LIAAGGESRGGRLKLSKLNAAFALTGVANTLLGPMTPLLEARWKIGDREAGLLFTALFLTSVCGAVWVGPLARQFGYLKLAAAGLALTGLGMAGCAFAAWPIGIACVAGYGLGLGFAIPAGNLSAAQRPDGARAVLWLNWSWCAGAVAAPALTAWFGMNAWWIGGAGLAICAALLASDGLGREAAEAPGGWPRAISRVELITGAFLFIYVATGQAIGGWVASLALRGAATARFWAAAPSIFWAGLLTGRALAAWLLRTRRAGGVVFGGLAVAAAGAPALILAHSAALSLAAAAICGIGLAPVYPLVVAQYASGERRTSGVVFAAGGLGGAVGPLTTGYVSQATGNLRAGLMFALPAIAAMAWLQGKLGRR
jgi:MFS transporter, FHS family, glucose/mannose:H+ symporter